MEISKYLTGKYRLPLIVFLITFTLLSFVQMKAPHPMILAERFFKGYGWLELLFVSAYGFLITYKMQDAKNAPLWRKISGSLFCVIFFTQLIAGLTLSQRCLMAGKLHLPIPMMILGGPVYRGELSVMTILFLSTVILTGPAWCSHLCYFGAFDNLASGNKRPAAAII